MLSRSQSRKAAKRRNNNMIYDLFIYLKY